MPIVDFKSCNAKMGHVTIMQYLFKLLTCKLSPRNSLKVVNKIAANKILFKLLKKISFRSSKFSVLLTMIAITAMESFLYYLPLETGGLAIGLIVALVSIVSAISRVGGFDFFFVN